ncbi:MAG: NAD-dependent epimerase/dehydratase family protein [Actinomycetota bacterium]|nr:NAD-dependent epimerase/dehydratase family protein [Actinomycetota bacterium]MEC9058040.1 NAD-dependent epimerase/dehydratase family protein [Actinomycetota bacterium]MED5361161.1 NAD-dependent epimerase/dehydratase family protein [Actinomycetota bacterium]MEE3257338.1 NAD-dependent epimerase/dehydratase family protein [Actinomycetota bacterium]
MTKRALVCGAGGFIGSHLVNRLVNDGYWVRGADIKHPEWNASPADEFLIADLRDPGAAVAALEGGFDEVYQLAADMGGMGFIHSAETQIMHNSMLINVNVVQAAAEADIERYFLASSVCVYRDMELGEAELTEDDAYPALPDNEYGWEKLYAERAVASYAREGRFQARIARFQNCYGPEGTWTGGREKAPAALCRKVAESADGSIDVWGDGSAVRSFIYIDDLVEGVRRLMDSEMSDPTNIGTREYVSVKQLAELVGEVAGKRVSPHWVEGPVGVQNRNFSNDRIESLGFQPKFDLADGLARTYPWIKNQVASS